MEIVENFLNKPIEEQLAIWKKWNPKCINGITCSNHFPQYRRFSQEDAMRQWATDNPEALAELVKNEEKLSDSDKTKELNQSDKEELDEEVKQDSNNNNSEESEEEQTKIENENTPKKETPSEIQPEELNLLEPRIPQTMKEIAEEIGNKPCCKKLIEAIMKHDQNNFDRMEELIETQKDLAALIEISNDKMHLLTSNISEMGKSIVYLSDEHDQKQTELIKNININITPYVEGLKEYGKKIGKTIIIIIVIILVIWILFKIDIHIGLKY